MSTVLPLSGVELNWSLISTVWSLISDWLCISTLWDDGSADLSPGGVRKFGSTSRPLYCWTGTCWCRVRGGRPLFLCTRSSTMGTAIGTDTGTGGLRSSPGRSSSPSGSAACSISSSLGTSIGWPRTKLFEWHKANLFTCTVNILLS